MIVGGAFLLTPGFITDFVGLLLLIPPTRAVIARGITRMLARRGPLRWTTVVMQPGARRPASPTPPARRAGRARAAAASWSLRGQ